MNHIFFSRLSSTPLLPVLGAITGLALLRSIQARLAAVQPAGEVRDGDAQPSARAEQPPNTVTLARSGTSRASGGRDLALSFNLEMMQGDMSSWGADSSVGCP